MRRVSLSLCFRFCTDSETDTETATVNGLSIAASRAGKQGLAVLEKLEKAYCPKEEFPLGAYAVLTAVFNALLIGAVSRPDSLDSPDSKDEPGIKDVVLTGIATHKLSRILTKDAVTAFVRAPFVSYEEPLGYGEVSEKPRHGSNSPAVEAVGELLNCNYCMSAWVGLGFLWGMKRFPKQTRQLAGLFTSVAIADFLHVIYEERRTSENVLTLKEDELDRRAS